MPNKIKYPVVAGRKECGTCHLWKSTIEYDKARRHYVSSCKPCRKIYAAEYRARPENKQRSKKYHKAYMADPENRAKSNAYGRQRNKRQDVKDRRNLNRRKWSAGEKRKAVAYKGGGCQICSYNKCLAALDFHHPDPSLKEGYKIGALRAHWTFEKNKPELDKCICVCVRCHREIHAGLHPEFLVNGKNLSGM